MDCSMLVLHLPPLQNKFDPCQRVTHVGSIRKSLTANVAQRFISWCSFFEEVLTSEKDCQNSKLSIRIILLNE